MARRCIALLGGSFDPVHNGHIALAECFIRHLSPDQLRIVPAGNPWQKQRLRATAADRVAMLCCAFGNPKIPVTIDQQEIRRHTATYTIETLRSIRAELGPETSVLFLIGADQLQQLHTWQEWEHLFDYAHICAASRPGFAMDTSGAAAIAAREFMRRIGTPDQIRNAPHGMTYLARDLAVDISATEIRAALIRGERPGSRVPHAVLEYIEQHHLYKN